MVREAKMKNITLEDVKNALSDVYGDIINTVLWNTSNDGIWYHLIIKIKCNICCNGGDCPNNCLHYYCKRTWF